MNRRSAVLSLSVAVVACAAMSIGGTSGGNAQVGPGPQRLAAVGIVARIGHDRVRSAGVIIDGPDGRILTTAHTLWGATSIKLMTGLAVLHGRLVARDPCDDIALVEMQPRLPGFAALSTTGGGPGAVVLRPRVTGIAPVQGLAPVPIRVRGATGALRLDRRLPPPHHARRLVGKLSAQDAGSGVIDGAGRLVGLVLSGQATAVELPIRQIRARLDELHPGTGTVLAGWRRHYRCSTRLDAYARAHHPGFRRSDARLNAPVPATRLPGTQGADSP